MWPPRKAFCLLRPLRHSDRPTPGAAAAKAAMKRSFLAPEGVA
jgi:hypothetical protein